MLEDQVAFLLQKYLGNYVRGLNKEALKISVWRGDVELTNMQLKPEALNALKLPVKVKAGFLGSVRLKVPWSRLGQEPVIVYLDRIFLLAEPATHVEGLSEDAVQDAKKTRIREMEMRLLESMQQLKSEMNTSWLGSLINTIIGNLKLSITNIHIRYEDLESNPGHPFAAGVTLDKLSAVTIDDSGKETFVTGGALDQIQKSVELERLALYFDSDIRPWEIDKAWEHLHPSEWSQVFEFDNKGRTVVSISEEHSYILQPVTGNAQYTKLRSDESKSADQPLQKASVNLDDVTLCLSKDGYRDILKLADNFAAFNQRLKYAHHRPSVSVKLNRRAWWKYAFKAVSDQIKKASGKLSWEQVLKYATLRKRYISLYASLLKSDVSRMVVDDNKDIEELDRGLDIEVILQWRMLAHKFVEQSMESELYSSKQKPKGSWWSFGWTGSSAKDENEPSYFNDEDWERLNKIIGYKEGLDDQALEVQQEGNFVHTLLEVHMKRNASKLVADQKCLAELSCKDLDCSVKLHSVAKVFGLRLGSYQLSSPNGLVAKSATASDSLVGVFTYKPFDANVDWSLIAKASPCYITYLKDSIDQIVKFFESSASASQTIALETVAAVQMTIDGVKRSAQQQVSRALKDHSRFFLDLDIAAPKITVPTSFCPDNSHFTKLLLDFGNFVLRTQDDCDEVSSLEKGMYVQFNLCLSDVSAFLVDGDYHWSQPPDVSPHSAPSNCKTFLPVIDKCGMVLKLQQIRSESPTHPSTRLAIRLPSLGFHFSPSRYHRLMEVAKIFQNEDSDNSDLFCPWNQSDFEGWLYVLVRKGIGNREAAWQRRYCCLVGPFLYVLESPGSKTYKQSLSLRGKQIYVLPVESFGDVEHVLAISEAGLSNNKVLEDLNALILRCDSDDSKKTWQSRFQGAIYRTLDSAPITSLSETSSDSGDGGGEFVGSDRDDLLTVEKMFITGVLDELKICFCYTHWSDQGFMELLLCEESQLFEFRAKGGQVELSLQRNDLLIGMLLKSLEIEDLVAYDGMPGPRYLARSFIKSTDMDTLDSSLSRGHTRFESRTSSEVTQSEGDEKFFEASEDLTDDVDSMQPSENVPENSLIKPPSFSRMTGLLPDSDLNARAEDMGLADNLDSFVKAQIVIYDQSSPLYNNIDKQVMVTLATLSFYCYRPTILAIMEFVNAINVDDQSRNSVSNKSTAPVDLNDRNGEDSVDDQFSSPMPEPVIKSLLGKGKSRTIFYLTLSMARAQIFLKNENGTSFATLSQNNLLTDIKVFPSSFSIKADLGNLKISDDSLTSDHSYFWVCDMRNPGGNSFVELVFTSFSSVDEDYNGYDFSLFGRLSEVRIIYLNRFVQEVISYFMGLVPNDSKGVIKLKDQVTNSEKWFTTSEIEGSPAVKLDLSLRKPIIVMPRRTDSHDYLELDVVHITVQNNFQWLFGDKGEMNAIHMERLTVQIEDINLTVGTDIGTGESIIRDVRGLSVVIQRSLRDLLHQIPTMEVAIKIRELKAALSNREYQIITECALSNISETPKYVPLLNLHHLTSDKVAEPTDVQHEHRNSEAWITLAVSVSIDLVGLSLYSGVTRDTSLATVQASGAWLLYKSNSLDEGSLLATLQGFVVVDDREGTKDEYRLAIGKPETLGYGLLQGGWGHPAEHTSHMYTDKKILKYQDVNPITTMLILDAKLNQLSTSVSLCIQRPQLLVALDFLLALAEFFVPMVHGMLSNEMDENLLNIVDAIVLDQPTYSQPSSDFSLSPRRPLIADDERFGCFTYDGKGGNLYLQNSEGSYLCSPTAQAIIYVGNGKRLQFKNVHIRNGRFLDSSIMLGSNSSYSASKEDLVYLEGGDDLCQNSSEEGANSLSTPATATNRSTEFIIELQAIGPELTFYNKSKDFEESAVLSNKLLHVQLDILCRLVLMGETMEMSTNALGLTMESNGIKILEPFDASISFSSASGKTNIHVAASDIFMNFSFSILSLFLAVENDIMTFLNMSSKKATVVCSQFDKVGTVRSPHNDQTYAFWRPQAPPGFAVLGDYLTPTNKPPTKGVLAVNTNFARVKKPVSFKLIWSSLHAGSLNSNDQINDAAEENADSSMQDGGCSIWLPVAPQGYVALGCVVSFDRTEPPPSSALCISSSLVSPCELRDCVTISLSEQYASRLAFWRVNNSIGSFLPADPISLSLTGRPYELRHVIFGCLDRPSKASKSSDSQNVARGGNQTLQSGRSSMANSGRRFEAIASFKLVWWNQGSSSRKKLSIWRPLVPEGMVFFGDIAVQGYEPPNTCIVLHDSGDGDEAFFRSPLGFQLVGQIKKHRTVESISFWFPQAPPGFVSLGCIASKGTPKQDDVKSLRCIRSDMVTGDQFSEESIWDTSDVRFLREPFSIWKVGDEAETFLVRHGFRKPPKRFALKLADPNVSTGSDDTAIDAVVGSFSAALFDDYGGLMVPLFNISLDGIGFSLQGRTDCLNSTLNLSLAARSYNDKFESWEPLIEPVDGFLRYQYDKGAAVSASQLRITSTRDLNLNVSVSNTNMILQAYASWNSVSHVHETKKRREVSPNEEGKAVISIHHKKNSYIIMQNKLGLDIYLRANEMRGLAAVKMSHGDKETLKVPMSKNMLDADLKGNYNEKLRTMVTIIILDGQLPLPRVDGLLNQQYVVAVRLVPNEEISSGSLLQQQSARTCGSSADQSLPDKFEWVNWNEMFFFKVDSPEYYRIEMIMTDLGKGEPVGFYSSPLKQIARTSGPNDFANELAWIELSSTTSQNIPQDEKQKRLCGKIRCAMFLSPLSAAENDSQTMSEDMKSGVIQISPARKGPWSTVKLSYAAPVACWRLGNDVIASEVSVKDGNRCVNIRSLVSITNSTDFILDLCLIPKSSLEDIKSASDRTKREEKENDHDIVMDELFETEKYNPVIGWVGCSCQLNQDYTEGAGFYEELSASELPSGWEWVEDWHVDSSTNTADGWVYAPDLEHLKWPESYNQLKFVNYARQRRWIRSRKQIPGTSKQKISVGLLDPGATTSLPLSGLRSPYVLQLRPWNDGGQNEYSWSSVVDNQEPFEAIGKPKEIPEICVSALSNSEELLHCSISESSASSSSDRRVHGLWFSLAIQSTEIGKDIHSDPIQDWNLVIKAPLSIANFLPLPAEFSVLEKQASGEFVSCSQGIFFPGKTVRIYADLGHPLYFSLIPQGGWLAIHKAVLLYHPSRATSKTISLRSLLSERTVQVILEQNQDKAQRLLARVVRVYVPYWIASARCPPLTCRLVEFASRRKASLPLSFPSRQRSEVLVEEITEAELLEGCTIDSILNFKLMGMSISIDKSSKKFYGPIQDLSPLGDMDGSVDLYAYDEDGKCMHLFISSKPCSFQSVPTKVISIRPFMTFTNRIGQDIFIKLNSEDEPKILCAFDSRVSFVYRKTEGSESSDKLQVRLEDTEWCIPVEITKEDTFSLVLRRNNCDRRFLRTEIRGNEEGSRFIVVFRLGSTDELIRIENRTVSKTISIRQSDLGDDAWIHLNPLSTINFSWEDPYGQRLIDARIHGENHLLLQKFDLTKPGWPTEETTPAVRFHVVEVGDLLVARFSEDGSSGSSTIEDNKVLASIGSWGTSGMSNKMQNNAVPIELIVELGIVGVSIIDQRPRELLYFYLEKVFISYSTGYSEGSTSRFKLILGNLQLDNQLPLTAMPVLLAPEQAADMHHPVFKMTVTMNNESVGGTQIYPYVYIRVTDKTWRLNIHEPIIWALVDFYNKLQLDRIPKSTNTSGIDPEIRVDLIDVSEVRLKLSLETEPTERPHGVLGVWSPVLSAVGNALKIQVHLRKVMRKNIFMRQSSVMPAIVNRFWRDLIHNPLHLIFSVDVLGMTSSTLASLSKGFAELSTDGQFLQLRSKQVWSRRITGVGDGVIQGTEALAQGVAFGVSGVVTKPVESARQYGLFGIAQGLGRAFLGFIVQPVSGALDFFSLTVDGIGASCSKCLEIFNNKATSQRIRNPRAIHADGVLREYCEREAIGQMVLYLAEASRHFGCTEIFKEPSKYAWSDHYEDHFMLPQQRFFLVTNKRVMLLQGMSLDKMEKKPSKIIWDVPWEELLALELAKAGYPKPSHLILHLKDFKKSEKFVRIIKCFVEEADEEPQAVRICSVVHKLWKAYQADMRLIELKVPSSQRHVYFTEEDMDRRDLYNRTKPIIIPRDFSSVSSTSEERRFMKHTINFQKIWSSEREPTGRCKLCRKQVLDDGGICTLWRPTCLDGYVSVGDIAHIGTHLPTFAALYHYTDRLFALPVGYDLVWRNCADDYVNPVSIWYPRAPDGFVSLGCVAVAGFKQPEYDSVYCVATSLAQDAVFEEQKVWAAPDSYPWACHIYQVQSEALHFIALRQQKEDSDWKPMRVVDDHHDCRTSERR